MPMSDATILSLSATPRRVAWHRVLDTDRAHSWFRDPLARHLAGGWARIAQAMAFANSKAWSHVAQIVLIDLFTAVVGVGGTTENRNWL
jgi:O-methyltransferase involved in polyketide biosynthesis